MVWSWQRINSWIRSCAWCGSFWGETDLYCEHCWEPLIASAALEEETHPLGYPIFSLWRWENSNHQRVSHLIYDLKGGQCALAFMRLSKLFAAQLLAKSYALPQPVLVPAPAKHWGKRDHASQFARQLSALLGAPAPQNALKRSGQTWMQKRLRVADRHSLSLEAVPSQVSALDTSRPLVFVDDVVTTGATATAAYKALKCPKDFSVWSLVRRPRLQR